MLDHCLRNDNGCLLSHPMFLEHCRLHPGASRQVGGGRAVGVTSTTTLTVGLEAPAMEGHSACDPKRRGRCGSTPSVVLVDENLYKPLYVCTKCVVVLAPRSSLSETDAPTQQRTWCLLQHSERHRPLLDSSYVNLRPLTFQQA